ncbi:MAG: penicillin-binding protein 2 [Streptosporangiales bacterium]|nr:penicillin-binding protein 2 [Streptosporangiales bacterium]
MNAPLRRLSVACLVLFGLLLVNVNYIQAFQADELNNNPRNSRVLIEQFNRERGPILVGNEPIARSVATEGTFKYQRKYNNGPLYAAVTGFYSLYSASGVERTENALLNGTDSQLFVRRFLDMITGEEVKGASVQLTLNERAQRAADEGLRDVGRKGAVVALDPKTGNVLAMSSLPTYDPNKLATHDGERLTKVSEKLNDDPDQPMLNRAINQTYPPGSTFKVVTAAAGLADGMSPDDKIPAPNRLKLPLSSSTIGNFGGASCNGGSPDTLKHSLQISCNTSFASLGIDLGADKMAEQAKKFGINTPGLEIPLRVSESHYPEGIDKAQTALTAIGQYEVRVTPLQMAMVAAGIANQGTVMKPNLIKEVKASDLSTLSEVDPETYSEAMDPKDAATLTGMMENVVSDGTAHSAQISGVRVAGKTGTAQNATGKPPHAWFISFAPAEDPQVAVAVVIESGGNLGNEATGGQLAAPIARDVMRAVIGK